MVLVRAGKHNGGTDPGNLLEGGLDFAQGNVLATREFDQILLTVNDLHRAVFHHAADVSRVEPSLPVRMYRQVLVRLLLHFVVPQLGDVVAGQKQLAPWRVVSHEVTHLSTRQQLDFCRRLDWSHPAGAQVLRAPIGRDNLLDGHRASRLRASVALRDWREDIADVVVRLGRQRSPTGADDAHLLEAELSLDPIQHRTLEPNS
mmetsp:Transcript_71838/g.187284  ORF Transcript_71838/g.187284 Transcript_71838/m.187284 type:complete len:203 (+) Transcript_71838:440-1048(+)